jgi:hypothetical protein
MVLCGELALEEAMDLSQGRRQSEKKLDIYSVEHQIIIN